MAGEERGFRAGVMRDSTVLNHAGAGSGFSAGCNMDGNGRHVLANRVTG